MTELQAALGLSQMTRQHEFVTERHRIAAEYDARFAGVPVATPFQHPDSYSGFHLYVIRVRLGAIGRTHREVFDALRVAGVGVNLHYIPVYLQPDFAALGFTPGLCPNAEAYYAEAISLPMFPALSDADMTIVVEAVRDAVTTKVPSA